MVFLTVIRLFIIGALIKIDLETSKPFWCAGIYAVLCMGARWLFGVHFLMNLLLTAISFGLASLFFWLVDRFEGEGGLWWLIVIVGALLLGIV